MEDMSTKAKLAVLEEIKKLMGGAEDDALKSKSPKFAMPTEPKVEPSEEDAEAMPEEESSFEMPSEEDTEASEDEERLKELYAKIR